MARTERHHLTFGWCLSDEHDQCLKRINGSTGVNVCDCPCHNKKGKP